MKNGLSRFNYRKCLLLGILKGSATRTPSNAMNLNFSHRCFSASGSQTNSTNLLVKYEDNLINNRRNSKIISLRKRPRISLFSQTPEPSITNVESNVADNDSEDCPHPACLKASRLNYSRFQLISSELLWICSNCDVFVPFGEMLFPNKDGVENPKFSSKRIFEEMISEFDEEPREFSVGEVETILSHNVSLETLKFFKVVLVDNGVEKNEIRHDSKTRELVIFPYFDHECELSCVNLALIKDSSVGKIVRISSKPSIFGLYSVIKSLKGGSASTIPESSFFSFGRHNRKKEIVITDNEFDAMSVHENVKMYAVSINDLTQPFSDEFVSLLRCFHRVYFWFRKEVEQSDFYNDAKRVGIRNCFFVNFTDKSSSSKRVGACDASMNGLNISKILANASPFMIKRVLTFDILRDKVFNEFFSPNETVGILLKSLPSVNRITKGHRRGELTVLTGPTGIGKTTRTFAPSLHLNHSC